MKKFFIVVSFFVPALLFSQDSNYAREVVDTLTSEYFTGRGAANQGEKKAADYIVEEFKKHGVKAFNNKYLQSFNSPINTFPKEIKLEIDGKQLSVGEDFLVGPSSGRINDTYEIVWYDAKKVPSKSKLDKLVFRNYFKNKIGGAEIITQHI